MNDAAFSEFLSDISVCFTENDFELWHSRILLPFSMVTPRGPVVMSNADQLYRNFKNYIQACEILGIDRIDRQAIALTKGLNGTFIGTYSTSLMNSGAIATDPFVSSALLHEADGGWKMSSILNARGHDEWTGKSPRPTADNE